jgi:hypothetical protein
MATGKRTFRAEATPMDGQELGATAESVSTSVNLETDGYIGSHATVSVVFHASGAQNVVIALYGSLDGTNFDTIPLFSQQVAVTAGATKQISLIVQDVLHFRVGARHAASETNVATVTVKEQSWRFTVS